MLLLSPRLTRERIASNPTPRTRRKFNPLAFVHDDDANVMEVWRSDGKMYPIRDICSYCSRVNLSIP